MNLYVIHSVSEEGWWNKKQGWVCDIKHATRFDKNNPSLYMVPLSKNQDAEFQIVYYGE